MREFIDEQGQAWGIHVDVNAIRKVRSVAGIDLTKVMDSKENLQALVDDVVALVDVLHVLCLEQCEHRKINAEAFAKTLYGDAISRATTALMESIIDFFPQGRGKILRQLWDKSMQVAAMQMEQVQAAVDALTLPISSVSTPDTQSENLDPIPLENLRPSQKRHGKRQHA